MSSYQSPPKFNSRPYRNILHDANSYNFNIVLRAFALSQLERIERNTPVEWDKYDDTTVTLAATGGTHPFPNRWGDPSQLSDAFIKECTVSYALGARGIGTETTGIGITFTVVEPNGMNFFTNILAAWNTVNDSKLEAVVGAFDDIPLLMSFYFGASNDVPGMEKTTRHIPISITGCEVDINSVGTTYVIQATSYATKFNDSFYQSPLFEKVTEITGSTVGEYLTSLIGAKNRTQADLEKTSGQSSSGQKKVSLVYSTKAVGPEAESFFNSRLSSQIESGNDLNSFPLNSVDEIGSITEPAATPNTTPSTSNTNARTLAEVDAKLKEIIDAKAFGQAPTPPPAVKAAIDAAAGYYNLSPANKEILFKIAYAESSYNPKAANKTSSATGLFQIIDETWNGLASELSYELVKVPSRATGSAAPDTDPRVDPIKNAKAGALYFTKSVAALNRADIPVTLYSAYTAHFFGPDTAARFYKLLNQNSNSRADLQFPKQAASNISIFYKDTKGNTTSSATSAEKRKADYERIRGIINAGYNSNRRSVTIPPGMTFANVLQRLLLNSEYALAALQNVSSEGPPPIIPWFKIYVTVKFGKYDPEANTLQKEVTFNVLGTELVTNSPVALLDKNRERVSQLVKERTIRAYNYLYTGKNLDVKNLEINLNTAVKSTISEYASFARLMASQYNSTIGKGTQTTVDGKENPAPSASNSGNAQQKIYTLGELYGKGFGPDFNQTEKLYRQLLPHVFAKNNFGGSLAKIELEIVGDPELIPMSESVLTEAELLEKYREWGEEGKRGLAVTAPVGFSTQFFLLVIGNPDIAQRTNNLLSGYYVYQSIIANFRESGEFTMNLTGDKFILEVVTEESKKAGDIYNQQIISRELNAIFPTFGVPELDNTNNNTNGLLQGPKNGLNAALNNAFTNVPALKNPITGV